MQWDWFERRGAPWGGTAYVLLGTLPHSSRVRGVLAESLDQPHLVEAIDKVLRRHGGTPRIWRTNITERYGGFTIIVLGEVVAAIAAAVQGAVDSSRTSPGLITAAAAGLVLVFALWWLYFKRSAAEEIRQSLSWTFVWAFAHYLIFAAVAALGAGLQVVIGTLTHSTRVAPAFAAFTVAIPVTTCILVLALLSPRGSGEPAALRPTLLTAAVTLAAAAATPALTLPFSIVIMAVLVALLLAYHLTAALWATRQPER
jgi:low temperature requirement protein LtrA